MRPDFLFIKRLKIPVRIGTTAAERAFPQIVLISIDVETQLEKAGRSDDLKDTVDYAAVVEHIERFVKNREFTLAESLANGIAEIVLKHRSVTGTRVRIEKKVLRQVESVGVEICRRKKI
jgi:FolB domain-containing protein